MFAFLMLTIYLLWLSLCSGCGQMMSNVPAAAYSAEVWTKERRLLHAEIQALRRALGDGKAEVPPASPTSDDAKATTPSAPAAPASHVPWPKLVLKSRETNRPQTSVDQPSRPQVVQVPEPLPFRAFRNQAPGSWDPLRYRNWRIGLPESQRLLTSQRLAAEQLAMLSRSVRQSIVLGESARAMRTSRTDGKSASLAMQCSVLRTIDHGVSRLLPDPSSVPWPLLHHERAARTARQAALDFSRSIALTQQRYEAVRGRVSRRLQLR